MPELTNTEFAAHLRVAAKMIDCEDNYGNPIVPGIVRSMKKAADIIDTDEAAIAALQAENGSKDKEIERLRKELTQAHTMENLTDYNQDYLRSEIKRVEAERDAAKKCIYDIETYLAFGSAQYIGRTIQAWKSGAQGEG